LEAGNISNISVVQPATVPIKPIRPRKLLNLALGIFLGVLGAVGLAFVCEYLDHSIKTPEEAEMRLQLPTLASIPLVRSNRMLPAAKSGKGTPGIGTPKRWKSRVLAAELKRSTASSEFAKIWNVPARIRQQCAVLAEQLLLRSSGSTEKPCVLAIVSCQQREGVSTVATNLSASLAQQISGDVLLVDMSTARPSVHRIFRNGQDNGGVVLDSPEETLPLLAADSRNKNLLEVLDSDRFTKQLSSVKKPYRFVVIDLPALSEASFVPRLSSLCDDVVMVVEAEHLRWEVVHRAKERLVKSQANILGVVLNKRRFHIPAWLYQTL
jgi:Mrp family chromosome partitioning ATPase